MQTPAFPLRLGVYSDLVYRSDAGALSTDRSFVNFVTALSDGIGEVVLFGRLDPKPGRDPYPVEGVRFVPLPHYPSVFSTGRLLRALPGSCRAFADELDQLDAVWLFGPAPLAAVFALIALRRRTPVFLGVRQDYPEYIRSRLPSPSWSWAVAVAKGLDLAFRLVARRAPTLTVGEDLARRYSGGSAPVLPITLSLVSGEQIVDLDEALARNWDGELRLLSVGRLDPEKNPLLLLDVMTRLLARNPRWRLTVAGEGPLAGELARGAADRGLDDDVELRGYVPNGPALWELYRRSHALLHVSLTEGLPQVISEAEAAGLPIVATAVGGVAAALGQGARGLLVPPRDPDAAVDALERLAADEALRSKLVRAELDHARGETLEVQRDRVIAFFRQQLGREARA